MSMDEIFEKIIQKRLSDLTYEDHKKIYIYRSQQYDWTKKLWTYVNSSTRIFWPIDYTDLFFSWNKQMINYYDQDSDNTIDPIIVIFQYDIYIDNNLNGATGKYIHYHKNMTKELWNTKKELIKEKINHDYIKLTGNKINKIKIYNIRVKQNTNYESDDDGYGYISREKTLKNKINIPKLPDLWA